MDDVVRVGKVSSINGTMIRVTYPDRTDTVTDELPLLTNGVYRPPIVGETVVVVHMSNGTTGGICLGGIGLSGLDYPLATLYQRLADDEQRITNLENRVTALEGRMTGAEGDISSLDDRVTALGG